MTSQLTFITTTGSNLDKDNAKLMRGHVTRQNFRQRRDRKAVKSNRCSLEIEIPVNTNCNIPLPGSDKILERRLGTTPQSPITDFPLKYHPGLISYVIQTTRPFLFQSTDGNPEERAWLDLVFSDSAVLEASLCVAETQRCLVQRGAVDYANVGRYKRNAIKMIGERLNDPALRISEGTLNAVLALAYSEQLVNNKNAWKTHLNGFIQMVKLRDSGLEPAMGHFSLSDVFGAISGLSDPQPLDQSLMTELPPDFAFMIIESPIRDDFFVVLRAIFEIQQTLQSIYRGDTTKTDQRAIDNQIRVIQSQLISLSLKAAYNRPICISLMIFLLLVRSQSQANSSVLEELAARTKEYLESIIEVRFCNAVDLIFWTLSIGGIAASKPSTRQWFLLNLKKILPALHLRSLNEAKKVLERFFWIDHVLSDQFSDFWNELQRI